MDVAAVQTRRREANDAIARRARGLGWRTDAAVIPFVCECGHAGCAAVTQRSLDEYDVARAEEEPLLVAGHLSAVETHPRD